MQVKVLVQTVTTREFIIEDAESVQDARETALLDAVEDEESGVFVGNESRVYDAWEQE